MEGEGEGERGGAANPDLSTHLSAEQTATTTRFNR